MKVRFCRELDSHTGGATMFARHGALYMPAWFKNDWRWVEILKKVESEGVVIEWDTGEEGDDE